MALPSSTGGGVCPAGLTARGLDAEEPWTSTPVEDWAPACHAAAMKNVTASKLVETAAKFADLGKKLLCISTSWGNRRK